MSNRLDQEKEAKLQPKRKAYAIQEIERLGFKITHSDETRIEFLFKDRLVKFFPYSGWASGASIKDGRGIENLLKQLQPSNT